MTICNHAACDTAFCPHCGNAVDNSPIAGLRAHVLKTRNELQTRADKCRQEREAAESTDARPVSMAQTVEHRRQKEESVAKSAGKWNGWLEALDVTIAKAELTDVPD